MQKYIDGVLEIYQRIPKQYQTDLEQLKILLNNITIQYQGISDALHNNNVTIDILTDDNDHLKVQLDKKEKEIERLNKLLNTDLMKRK